jgi:enediyne biosynthesis protein E3
MTEALLRIERIKSVFLDTQIFYSMHDNIDALIGYLENTETEFRSIAYESASMAIALKELKNNEGLNTWLYYKNGPALAHKAQVHVGLGWAIAKLNLPFLAVVNKIDTSLYYRVADGCGYYDGSFRHKQTIMNRQLPGYIPNATMSMYDQGVGRSLWYTCSADINKICSMINSFPAVRQASLWRGIGIAVAYVGGCDDDTLKILLQYAATNRIQLTYGAALALGSRIEANTLTKDTAHCSRLWFSHTASEANIFSLDPANPVTDENEQVYFNWIKQVSERLANSFETEY